MDEFVPKINRQRMKTIVVSAVNLKVGGTLTILRDCLSYLSELASNGEYRVVALVFQKDLAYFPNIEYIELQWPKKTWISRLWCEYVYMKKISKQLAPVYLWFSLHDTTPTVEAERRAVYCHNSFPFYKWKARELFFAPKIVLFALFSTFAYRVNIHRNKYIVVQQEWFRRKFIDIFGLKKEQIIVAPPTFTNTAFPIESSKVSTSEYQFFYPAAPDSHKNFECICDAVDILVNDLHISNFSVNITITGEENKYTKWVSKRIQGKNINSNLHLVGYLNKNALWEYYHNSQCLLFPSKVETWGLPITEFGVLKGKSMLLSDLPYAYETAQGSERVGFFDPENPADLANKMKLLIENETQFLQSVEKNEITPPVAYSWDELFKLLLK